MNHQSLIDVAEGVFSKAIKVLDAKRADYGIDVDRLAQFKKIAVLTSLHPIQVATVLAAKHFTSIADMAPSPTAYSAETWAEKTGDLINYAALIVALMQDEEVKAWGKGKPITDEMEDGQSLISVEAKDAMGRKDHGYDILRDPECNHSNGQAWRITWFPKDQQTIRNCPLCGKV